MLNLLNIFLKKDMKVADAIFVYDSVQSMIEDTSLKTGYLCKTKTYYEGDLLGRGAATYKIITSSEAEDAKIEVDGMIHHSLQNNTVAVLQGDAAGFVTLDQMGLKHSLESSSTPNCEVPINQALAQGLKIRGKTGNHVYYTQKTIVLPEYATIEADSIDSRGWLYFQKDSTNLEPVFKTKDIEIKEVMGLKLYRIGARGFRETEKKTDAQVYADYKWNECMGFYLSCGASSLHIYAAELCGIGILHTNLGDPSRYTHGCVGELQARRTAQEGIILDGGNDHRYAFCESQWAWDSFYDQYKDTANTTKTSKWLDFKDSYIKSITAGMLYYDGAAEVIEQHHHNNHYGPAWATLGQNGASYRLRIGKAIGENSAQSFYIGTHNDVVFDKLIGHDPKELTRSIPFMEIHSNFGVTGGDIFCRCDRGNGNYDEGLFVTGDNCNFDVKIFRYGSSTWKTGLHVTGDNNTIGGYVKNITDGESVGLAAYIEGSGHKIDLNINNCFYGYYGGAGANNIGEVRLQLSNVVNAFAGNALRYRDERDMRRWVINDISDDKSTILRPASVTLSAGNCDGTNRTAKISKVGSFFPYTDGARYHSIKTKSLTMSNKGTPVGSVWIDTEHSETVTIGYNITAGSDVEVWADFYYGESL